MLKFDSTEWEGVEGMAEELLLDLRPPAEKAMWQGGMRFQRELKKTLSGTRSGRSYVKPSSAANLKQKRRRNPTRYVASAPGEPPAAPTGTLRNSMGFSRPKWKGLILDMDVGSGLGVGADGKSNPAYARRMEFGGADSRGVKIAPRPYMAPTALRMESILNALFKRIIE